MLESNVDSEDKRLFFELELNKIESLNLRYKFHRNGEPRNTTVSVRRYISIVHNSERFAEFVPYDSRAFWKFFKNVRVKVERKELYGNKFVISFVVERSQSCMDASLLT